MATPVCQICDYSLNKTIRKPIKCQYCDFEACKSCCERYILNETAVRCMNTACGRDWTRQYIKTVFPTTFITGKLKEHREAVLFDIERALLPATQPLVERQIKAENLLKREQEIRAQIRDLYTTMYQAQVEMRELNYGRAPIERQEFIKACPESGCRGFLSSQWKCGICEKWSCPRCHEVKGPDKDSPHECNPETVATVSLLANDTKPCPNCRMGIHKLEGCPQMFCTGCNTAFNWNTGRIETGPVHNPHYFEWLRRNGTAGAAGAAAPGANCRRELTHQTYNNIRNIFRVKHKTHPLSKTCEDFLSRFIRNTLHIRYAVMTGNEAWRNWTGRNESLRIAYMRNRITEADFKTQLQRSEKKAEKSREIYNVLEILVTTATDIIHRFEDHLNAAADNMWEMTILEEIDPIVEYANECLRDISKTYNSKRIVFSNELREK